MADHTNKTPQQRTARILSGMCGVLFVAFCFVYLWVLQRNVVSALHYVLSQGRTHYSPLIGAVIITLILYLIAKGMDCWMGLKGPLRPLAYFPSCLLLGALTNVHAGIFHGEGMSLKCLWFLLAYVGIWAWQRNARSREEEESSVWITLNSNLAILLLLFLMTACIGNTNVNFHHSLAVEQAIRDRDVAAARRVGAKSLETDRTLTALRAYALSLEGTMGEYLFAYPQPYGADGLLLDPRSRETLYTHADSLYVYLGAKPRAGEKTTDYLERICREGTGKYTALDYYLSALLLDRELERFASAVEKYYFRQEPLPRYYREALLLYRRLHPQAAASASEEADLAQRWDEFLSYKERFSSPAEEKNRMRQAYGDTYWWYYLYP